MFLYEPLLADFTSNWDIIKANFVDTYDNLTLKSRSALTFFSSRCQNSNLLVLLDDDVVIKKARVFQEILGIIVTFDSELLFDKLKN